MWTHMTWNLLRITTFFDQFTMENIVKSPVLIYTEQTPNPESLKFVTNRILYRGTVDFKDAQLAAEWSPLAWDLFEFPFVKGVYVSNNFVTITKEFGFAWDDIMLKIKEFIKNYVTEGKPIIKEGYAAVQAKLESEKSGIAYNEDEAVIVQRVKELIETYVKPAVEMDGGNIEFHRYEAGKVFVTMHGSCSGCPSSTVTLKAGIEGMLKRMVPEVVEVVAEMG